MHYTPSTRLPTAADEYPSGDGRPLAETPVHRRNLVTLIDVLDRRFADDPLVYVSGNMFVYYERGNKLKHVAPDVFLVRGVPKVKRRDYYLVWDEGYAPNLVIELTSASTADEDLEDKKSLYQSVLGVREYVLFDPRAEYLDPPLQGFRLEQGEYQPIDLADGRLPSVVTGLHFEANGEDLRLHDPATGLWLPTAEELLAETKDHLAETSGRLAETSDRLAEKSAENERLQQELAELRRQLRQQP